MNRSTIKNNGVPFGALVLLLAIWCWPAGSLAQGSGVVSLSPSSQVDMSGDTDTLWVGLSTGLTGVKVVSFNISCDGDHVTLNSVINGPDLPAGSFINSRVYPDDSVLIDIGFLSSPFSGPGTIAGIVLTAHSAVSETRIEFSRSVLRDALNANIPHTTQGAGITIQQTPNSLPVVILNAPPNDSTTPNNCMRLSTTVSDADNDAMTVMIFGDNGTASDLLHVQQGVYGPQTITYDWCASALKPEVGHTMGLWHLDEYSGTTVRDASGNNNNGTVLGGAAWTVPGRFGYCLDLDGIDDYLDIPDASSLDIDSATGELTIEAWINPAASGGMHWRKIVAKRYAGTGSEATNYEMCLDQTTGNLTFYNGRMAQVYISSVHPPLGQWSYVAISLSAVEGVLRFYLNGQELDQMPGAVFGAANSYPLQIGTGAMTSYCFDGLIDEVRLSRRVLAPAEIEANYELPTGRYYWRVVAKDAPGDSTVSSTRFFNVSPPGADVYPPVITLNSPPEDSVTPNHEMRLDWAVTDENPMSVWIYGSTSTNPTDLLSVRSNVTSGSLSYDWVAPVLSSEPTYTMGLWHLDDGAGTTPTDNSGNGNHGSFSGAPIWSASSRFGYALTFDGTDDYVSIPDAPSLDMDSATGAITVEAWIYPHASGSNLWRSILAKRAMSSAPGTNYEISLDRVTGNLLFYSGHYPQIWISSVSIPLNQWSYVAVTLQASEGRLRFYRNGMLLDSTVTYSGSGGCFGGATSSVLTIGTAGQIAECFDGVIDEVRLTGRVLSSTEIADNYRLRDAHYFWKVRARDTLGNESISETREFIVGAYSAPTIPTLLRPMNGSNTTDHTPAFIWSTPAGSGVTYTLEYARDAGFTVGKVTLGGLLDTSYTPASDLGEGLWFWHVQAVGIGGSSGYQTTPFSFTILQPGTVFLQPDSTMVRTLDTVSVQLRVDNNVIGIHCFKVSIDFDTSLLQIMSITEGPLLKAAGTTFFFWDNLGHPTDIGNCILGFGLKADGPGVLAVVKFRATLKGGTSPLTFSYVSFSDVNLDSMDVGHTNGKIVVNANTAPAITSSAVVVGTVGQPYQYDVDATGIPVPTYALVAGYPTGMTINSTSGLIQWTPAAAGDYPVTVQAINVAGTATQSFAIHVSLAPQAPAITSSATIVGTVGQPYQYDVDATGYPVPTYALVAGYPAGMTINSTSGLIQWTPAAAGDYPVTVQAVNVVGTATQSFTIHVSLAPQAPAITSSAVTVGTVGQPYQYDVDATGNPAPTYALVAGYPAGMTINSVSGLIQWTPAANGDYPVTVQAINVAGTATQSFTIHVSTSPQAPTITSTPVMKGNIGVLYVYDVDATGFPIPTYALQSTPIPPTGMTIDAGTGVIQWMPSTKGDFDVAVKATNAVGMFIQAFTIRVGCCIGTTGNVNMMGIVDLSDLSALVSYLTGGGYVLPCEPEANVNNAGIVDLSDLSALVSYLTGGGYVLPNCP